jgi:hypothetical protein
MRHPSKTRAVILQLVIHLTTIVSRKTPLDGRLEIPESLANRLADSDQALRVVVGGEETVARLEEMACTCAKAGGNHTHHFLVADDLKSLPGGATAHLTIDIDQGIIGIDT